VVSENQEKDHFGSEFYLISPVVLGLPIERERTRTQGGVKYMPHKFIQGA
jgi:hypothetical protein